MTDLEQEAAWRTEFEADGERAVHDTIYHGLPDDALRIVMRGEDKEDKIAA